MKRLALVAAVAALLVGCGEDEDTGPAPPSRGPSLTGHLRDIYDQQRGVCRLEQRENTVEYREQDGANDPQGYAEYAAKHGFYAVRDDAELNAAIEGCLAGLRP